jgi:hypothetical protein
MGHTKYLENVICEINLGRGLMGLNVARNKKSKNVLIIVFSTVRGIVGM